MKNYELNVPLLNDELWWGGAVDDGIHMPYGQTPFTRSLDPNTTENQAMPLLISNKGRYIWSEEPFEFLIDKESLKVSSTKGQIKLFEGYDSLKEAYQTASENHFKSSGQLPDPLLFTAPQYNTWIELMYDQTEDRILEYAQNLIHEGYPPGVLMIDDNWQEDYGVLRFHEGRFNDPKGLIKQLHQMGFKVMLWVSPFISPDSETFRQLEKSGYLLDSADGTTAIRRWWNGYSAVLDLTNSDAVQWFKDDLNTLMTKYGIDGFKFDAGDPRFYRDDDSAYRCSSAQEHCRSLSLIGLEFELNELRTSWKTAGLPLAQRLADKNHSWGGNGLSSLIPNGIAQGLMGYAFTCPDMIGGGQYLNFLPEVLDIDEELVVRYAQCSALFPMMQFSVAPWRVLSKENAQLCLDAAQLHLHYGDYILNCAKSSAQTGEPTLRSLAYEYGDAYNLVNDQFMIGQDLMVAPIITKECYSRNVLIPEGQWKADDGNMYDGPCSVNLSVPIERLPYFIRQK